MDKEHFNEVIELSKKLGLATGVLQGVLYWDIPKELREKIKNTLKQLEDEQTEQCNIYIHPKEKHEAY